jgi:hypothetical protein
MLQVYNPDDEELVVTHGAREFKLKPLSITGLPDLVAKHAESTLGMWGVKIIYGPSKADIELAIQEANKTCEAKTRAWAEETYIEWRKANQDKLDVGIKLTLPAEVSQAKNWLMEKGILG